MSTPPRYGLPTFVGAAVILISVGSVAQYLREPAASTAHSTQVPTRPTPRIIEINTKRDDAKREEFKREDIQQAEPVKQADQATAPPAPQFATPEPPPVSAAELKRKAQEEAPQIADDTAGTQSNVASVPPRRKSQSRVRYPKYDRHAVY